MLSAEEVIEKWTEALVKELQSLPQQKHPTKSTILQPKSGGEKVWGLKVPKKLGDSARAVAAQEIPVPKPLEAVIVKDAARAKIAGIAVTDGAELTALSAPAEIAQQALLVPEGRRSREQEAPLQTAAMTDVAGEEKHRKDPVEIEAASPETLHPEAATAPSTFPADSATGSAGRTETGARMAQLEALKIGPARATAMNVTKATMKIPKEWLSKMQNK